MLCLSHIPHCWKSRALSHIQFTVSQGIHPIGFNPLSTYMNSSIRFKDGKVNCTLLHWVTGLNLLLISLSNKKGFRS